MARKKPLSDNHKFAAAVQDALARMGASSGYVIFAVYGPYDHNPYDTPLRAGFPSPDFPSVFRALHEAVSEIKHGRGYRELLAMGAKLKIEQVSGRALAGTSRRPVLEGSVVWRSWSPRDRAYASDRARSRRSRRGRR